VSQRRTACSEPYAARVSDRSTQQPATPIVSGARPDWVKTSAPPRWERAWTPSPRCERLSGQSPRLFVCARNSSPRRVLVASLPTRFRSSVPGARGGLNSREKKTPGLTYRRAHGLIAGTRKRAADRHDRVLLLRSIGRPGSVCSASVRCLQASPAARLLSDWPSSPPSRTLAPPAKRGRVRHDSGSVRSIGGQFIKGPGSAVAGLKFDSLIWCE